MSASEGIDDQLFAHGTLQHEEVKRVHSRLTSMWIARVRLLKWLETTDIRPLLCWSATWFLCPSIISDENGWCSQLISLGDH
jgi:hypothetical protein